MKFFRKIKIACLKYPDRWEKMIIAPSYCLKPKLNRKYDRWKCLYTCRKPHEFLY